MTIDDMRMAIMNAYSGVGWRYRCRKMDANQVIAIYHSFLAKGKLEPKKAQPEPPKKTKREKYHQMDLIDCFGTEVLPDEYRH